MKPIFKLFLLILLLPLASPTPLKAQRDDIQPPSPVILTDEQGEYPLGLRLEILEDPTGQLTIEDVASPEFEGQFAPSQEETPNFGYTNSAYWARFRVRNEASQTTEWRLALQDARMGYVDLYLPTPDRQGYVKKQAGRLLPFTSREVPYHQFIFNLPLPSQAEQTIYLRFQTESAMVFPLTLWSLEAFAQYNQREQFILGLFYGIMLIMLGYNLLLFLIVRDRSYLFLVLFIAGFLLNQASRDGLAHQYLWPGWPNRFGIELFGLLTIVSALKFTSTFLATKTSIPRLHKGITLLMIIPGLMILLIPFVRFLTTILSALTLLAVPVAVVAGFIRWRQGYRPARYYLLAWLTFFGAVILFGLTAFGLLPSNTLTEKSMPVGSVLLVLLFSLALADQINVLKAETEQANRVLGESERRLAQFLDALPVGVVILDAGRKLHYVNQRVSQMFGRSDPKIGLGHAWDEILAERVSVYMAGSQDSYPPERRPLTRALQGESAVVDDLEIEQNGQRISLEVWAQPIFDEQGNIQYAISAFQDITGRKRLEERLAIIYQLGRELTLLRDEQAIMQQVLNLAAAVLRFEFSAYGLVDETAQELVYQSYLLDGQVTHNQVRLPLDGEQGIGVAVVRSGQSLYIPDVSQDPRYVIWLAEAFGSELCVPLKIRQRVIGVLNAESSQINYFTLADQQLFQTLAGQAAVAIENARLHAEAQRRLAEQIALREAGMFLSSTLELETVLNYIAEQLGRAVDATSVYICDYEPETMTVTVLAEYVSPQAHPLEQESDLGVTYHLAQDFPDAINYLQTGRPQVKQRDQLELSHPRRVHMETYGAQTTLHLPLKLGDEIMAIAELWESRRRREFTAEEIGLCQAIAQQAAISLQNARLHEQIQRHAEELEQQVAERTAELAQETATLATLYRVTQEIVASLELEQVYVTAHQAARQLMPVDAFVIALLDETRQEVEDVYLFDQGRRWPNLRYPLGRGLTSTIITTGRPLRLDNGCNEASNQAVGAELFGAEEDTCSVLAVPLRLGDKILGVISAQAYLPYAYTDSQLQLLETLTNQVSISIANAMLYEQARQEIGERQRAEEALRRRNDYLAALHQIALDLLNRREVDEVLQTIVEHAAELLDAPYGEISLAEGDELVVRAFTQNQPFLAGDHLQRGEGAVSWQVYDSGQPVILENYGDWAGHRAVYDPLQLRATADLPILVGQKCLGVLALGRAQPDYPFDAEQVQVGLWLAQLAALVLDNAQWYATARRELAERQQVEQELRFQKTLLEAQNEATLDGILVVSEAREWLFSNQQYIELWGIPAEVAQSRSGRLALQHIKDKVLDPNQFLATVESLYAHPDLEIQDEVTLKDGRIFDRYSAPVQSKDGVYYGRVWYYRDITERKQVEVERAHLFEKQRRTQRALRRVNAQLQQRIEELAFLNYIAQTVATGTDLQAALAFVAEAITQHFNAFSTGISLFNEARTERTIVALAQVQDRDKLDRVGRVIPLADDITYTEYISQGKSLVIPDPPTNPYTRASQSTREQDLQCLMLIPLQTLGEIIGAIAVSTNQEGRVFTAAEVKLAETISAQIAGAIENARLFEKERQQRQIAESLREVAMILNRSLDREIVLTTIMEQLGQVIRYDSGSLFLQDGDDLVLSTGRNVAKRYVGHRIPLASANPSARIFKQKQPLIIADVRADPHWQMISDDPIRSWMGAPLVIGQKVMGVLTADSFEAGAYAEEDARILQTFANHAAVAIENALLHQQARQAAADEERNRLARNLHDSVTQALFSASLVAEVLPQIWQRDPDEAQQGLEKLRTLTKGALAEMRALLLELRPKAFLQAKLDDLLRQLSQAVASQAPLDITVDTEAAPTLPPEVQLTFYRVAQETFNNIVKHADATQVTVNLRLSPPFSPNQVEPWQGCVALTIRDNGRGFNPTHIAPGKLGLSIMRERAQDIGATLNLESQPGQGTEVSLIWPDSVIRK